MSSTDERRVVFALDDSEHSKYALRWALDNIIQPSRDRILLVSVGLFPQKVSEFVSAALGQCE
jgi:nucleotide-binding universal stress UspA family protein